jgi:transposase
MERMTGTVGLDLGDRYSRIVAISEDGEIVDEGRVQTSAEALKLRFGGMVQSRVMMEAGTQSGWVSRLLGELGHEVTVLEARQVASIRKGLLKSDRTDALALARMSRVGAGLLTEVRHKEEEIQLDLAEPRARDGLVRARTQLINMVRGLVKVFGHRVRKCDADYFARYAREDVPGQLWVMLGPAVEVIELLTQAIQAADDRIERLCEEKYPETARLQQVKGVGPVTSLAYVLTVGEVGKRHKARSVGAYVGMVPKKRQSGDQDPELRITKRGDELLRRLLVGCAHHVIERGPDTALQRWGREHAGHGGKVARRKAAVGVARKLSVLLHRLWVTGEEYEPLRGCKPVGA